MNNIILARLQDIFREIFQLPELVLTPATSPSDIPSWNSLNHVRLIAAVEKNFNLRFSLDDLMEITRVSDLLRILMENEKP
jgi:acyl carrier protein